MSSLLAAVFILLGGSMGIPMGLPPGPEDPVMSKIAPDDCVFYASWSGVEKIDPDANPTEKWMAQPMVSSALKQFRKAYRGMILKRGKENDDPVVRQATSIAVELVDLASTEPTAFYLNEFGTDKGKLRLQGAAVISLGNRADQIGKQFNSLIASITPAANDNVTSPIEAVKVAGKPAIRIAIPDVEFPVFAAAWDNYFVVGLGEGSLEKLSVDWKTPQPKWLSEMRQTLKIERVASLGYVDAPKIAKEVFAAPNLTNFFAIQPLKELSEEVRSVGWVSGLDSSGFLTRSDIQLFDHKTQIASILGGDPIPRSFLREFPVDPMVGFATRISTEEILKFVKSTAKDAGQKEALENSLQEFQKLTGVKLEEELLDAIGNFIYFYYNFDMANPQGGWLVSVRIEDEMSFPSIFQELNKGLKRWTEQQAGMSFKVENSGQYEVYSISDPINSWKNFAWALVDEQWYFARSPQAIINHRQDKRAEEKLVNHVAIKEMFEFGNKEGFGNPVAVSCLNLPPVLKLIETFLVGFRNSPDRIDPDLDFSFDDIPPLDELINDVQPNFSAAFRTDSGFQLLHRQTYPGASPPVSLFAIAAGTLPLAISEFENSQQHISKKRLQELSLAMLQFHDANMHFPAAYSTDDNGKPLLSWRVHLLPFLGHDDLYDQFRLEEPWDSEHNMKLVKNMPEVFRHPSLQETPGKTAFVVPTGDQAVFGPPSNRGEKLPMGKRIREINDGTSKTAMIVEVNKANAVFWTEPRDIGCHGGELLRKTFGIRDSGKFSVAFCDGSIRTLSQSIKPAILDNILKRNDGNRFHLPEGKRP